MITHDVIIVGAGPVGLVVACELAQAGVDAALVDRSPRDHSSGHSRANVVWTRNLELLNRIGVTDRLIEEGHRIRGTSFHADGVALGSASLASLSDTPYPFALMIPQGTTERVLHERAQELGVQLYPGLTLEDLSADPDGVTAAFEGQGGPVILRSRWLVGADGVRSTVRELAGIESRSSAPDVTFAICDAHLDTPLSGQHSHYLWSSYGAMAVGPMGGALHRLAVNAPHDVGTPDGDHFARRLREVGGPRHAIRGLEWSASFRVVCHVAETFRKGRILLAGDAAHVVSPAGGQGMNTGIGDAVNLGWRLAAVLRSGDDKGLDDYNSERRLGAAKSELVSNLMTRAGLVRRPITRRARNLAVRTAGRVGVLDRHLAPALAQTALDYGEMGLRRGVDRGARLPVLPSAHPRSAWQVGWPVLARDVPTLLHRHGADVREADLPRGTQRLEVPEGFRPLRQALSSGVTGVLVRPDGHVQQVLR